MKKSWLFLIPILVIAFIFPGFEVRAAAEGTESYRVVSDDKADLLQSGEEYQLREKMQQVVQYANVAFHTVPVYGHDFSTVEDYAESYFARTFGRGKNGTVFILDMQLRKVCVFSDGAAYRVITKGRANSITDNVYTYASAGRYLDCATEVFSEILTILEGGRIAEPMKIVSNIFLALALALLVMFLIVRTVTGLHRPTAEEWQASSHTTFAAREPVVQHTGTTRRYDPPSSSSSGGGGHSGGGGGGGHSGGGGSHSF